MKQKRNEQVEAPRPLLAHAAARIAFGNDAHEISDFAAALVPTHSDAYATPGEFIAQARQLRKMTVFLMTRAVLLERARGTSWSEIAAACNQEESWVRANWEPAERRWLAAIGGTPLAAPATLDEFLELPPGDVPVSDDEVRKAAELLDSWCARHAAAAALSIDDGPDARRPVTDGISTP